MYIPRINQFTYRGIKSYEDMGLIITQTPQMVIPQRDISYINVPGRSGDIINDNMRYNNIDMSYSVAAIADKIPLQDMIQKIKSWLQTDIGYQMLTDTYSPNYYRLAVCGNKVNFAKKGCNIATAEISYNCKPFRFSFAGQQVIDIAAPTTIYNPEAWPSQPKIKIVGNGDVTLQINGIDYKFTKIDGYIEIDTDMMMAYKDNALQNDKILFSSFPALMPGKNEIVWNGNVTQINIVPRWCCL